MNQSEAIKLLEQLANQFYQQGQITITPQAHSNLVLAINALRPKEDNGSLDKPVD